MERVSLNFILCLGLSHLLGSIPTAYLVGKLILGIDIRQHGSGNVGATNVFRVVGKKWGIGVLIFDMLKGFAAAFWIPKLLAPQLVISPFVTSFLFGIAAIAGHTWTFWLRFKGGKGVATSLGVLFALVPKAAGMALLVWFALFLWKHYVSLASLAMAVSFPCWVVVFYRHTDFFKILLPLSFTLTAFIFYTHRSNIKRLQEGNEKRLI